jgi:DNA-damage-inducible protein J
MGKESISFSIDEKVKKQAEELFNNLGMSMEQALNIFIIQSIKEKGIPFKITLEMEKRKEESDHIYLEELIELAEKCNFNNEIIKEFKKEVMQIKETIQYMREESKK